MNVRVRSAPSSPKKHPRFNHVHTLVALLCATWLTLLRQQNSSTSPAPTAVVAELPHPETRRACHRATGFGCISH